MLSVLLALAQISAPAAAPSPTRWSILDSPECGKAADGATIVVCAPNATSSSRLPLPDERAPPDHGVPSNPDRTGIGALATEGTPCAATQHGCTVGFGPPIVPMIKGAVGLAKSAFARKPDKTGRVPIDLGVPTP